MNQKVGDQGRFRAAGAAKQAFVTQYSSIKKMVSMTRGERCVEEGDYLAWGDMEWILHGQAWKETTEREETCEEKPLVDLYYTPFPGMDSCMQHCQNLGVDKSSNFFEEEDF